MIYQYTFVHDGFGTHVLEERFVFLVFAEGLTVGAEGASPERGEEVGFEAFLFVGFADDGAGEVEKLAVYAFEEGKEIGGVGEFVGDAFFEDGDEFSECSLQGLPGLLGEGWSEEGSEQESKFGGGVGGCFEEAEGGEEVVDVGVGYCGAIGGCGLELG